VSAQPWSKKELLDDLIRRRDLAVDVVPGHLEQLELRRNSAQDVLVFAENLDDLWLDGFPAFRATDRHRRSV